jgi:hypothetical protein
VDSGCANGVGSEFNLLPTYSHAAPEGADRDGAPRALPDRLGNCGLYLLLTEARTLQVPGPPAKSDGQLGVFFALAPNINASALVSSKIPEPGPNARENPTKQTVTVLRYLVDGPVADAGLVGVGVRGRAGLLGARAGLQPAVRPGQAAHRVGAALVH